MFQLFKRCYFSLLSDIKECFEEISRDLKGSDLLECTLVCPEWNEIIGSSKSCMKKIKFKMSRKYSWYPETSVEALRNSERKYECLELAGEYSENMKDSLVVKGRTWTDVTIFPHYGRDRLNQYQDLLRIFQFSIRKLYLYVAHTEKDQILFDHQELQFPNLEILECNRLTHHYDGTFNNCRHLKILKLNTFHQGSHASLNNFRKILKENKNLEALQLLIEYHFEEDFSAEISFKLRELTVSGYSYPGQSPRNFTLFLRTQVDTLEVLTMNKLESVEVLKIIFSMPLLKKLTFRDICFDLPEHRGEGFPKNNSITCLQLKCFIAEFRMFEIILKATPQIECLELSRLTDKIAELIPKACKSLKRIHVDVFEAKDILNESFYLNLLELTCIYNDGSQGLLEKLNGKIVDYFTQPQYLCQVHRMGQWTKLMRDTLMHN